MNASELYFLVSSILLVAAVAAAVLPINRGQLVAPVTFALLICATLVSWHFPALLLHQQLNPDESSFIAQAHFAVFHPIPWRDFDGTTSGPINTYLLSALHLLGAPFDYGSARIAMLILHILTVFALYVAVFVIWGDVAGRVSAAVATLFFAFSSFDSDFVHYSSETLPVALLSVLCLFVALITRHSRWLLRASIACGVLVGIIPFCKLQAIPIDAVLALFTVVAICAQRNLTALIAFAVSCALVPGLLLGATMLGGGWNDFFVSYVKEPLVYASAVHTPASFPTGHVVLQKNITVVQLFTTAGLISVWGLFVGLVKGRLTRFDGLAMLGLVALFAACTYAINRPNHPIGHYILFLLVPVAAFAGVSVGVARINPFRRSHIVVTAMLLCSAVLTCRIASLIGNPFLPAALGTSNNLAWYQDSVLRLTMRGSQDIALLSRIPRDSTLAVWGWAPEAYVVSGALLGTRDSQTQFSIWPGPYQSYYRRRFLNDMESRVPLFFLDAVRDRKYPFITLTQPEDRHEADPRLRYYIATHYSIVGTAPNGVRLYRRRGTGG